MNIYSLYYIRSINQGCFYKPVKLTLNSMKKFPIIIGVFTFLILIGGIFLFSKNKPEENVTIPSNIEYFWLEGCPHCKIVSDFMDTWDKKDQIKIDKLEVKTGNNEAKKLISVGKFCKIENEWIGSVPLLFTPEGKCFLGDQPIIGYLKTL
jgi:glutaredoxin